MKNLLGSIALLFISMHSFAQSTARTSYPEKSTPIVYHTSGNTALKISDPVQINETDPCNCWIERDSTWSVVPFDGSGGNGGPGVPPEYRNDDWSTAPINLPFDFCFYGATAGDLVINNNGNVSFNVAYATYTADSFPSLNFQMIAPFWSDFDTRAPLSGLVYYKMTSTSIIIQWDHVGYYSSHDDKLNTFQLIMTDGNDPLLDAGKNISFCYRDMQWTTGDASQGVSGFGGVPATVGINKGDGVNYIQIGRYDQPGYAYNGPYGGPAGVDLLDGQSYSFGLCNASNLAPFVNYNGTCDTVNLCVGDTITESFDYYSGEIGQITSASANFFGMQDASIVHNNPGNVANIATQFIGTVNNVGLNYVEITATDNGLPQQSTTTGFFVNVHIVNSSFSYSPSPIIIGDTITFTANSEVGATNIWNFGDGSPDTMGNPVTHIFTSVGNFTVTNNVTDPHCLQSATGTETVNILLDHISSLSSLDVNLFPNPSLGLMKFVARNQSELFSITVTNLQGQLVYENSNLRSNELIDFSNLNKGVYLYQIKNSNGTKQGRLLLE